MTTAHSLPLCRQLSPLCLQAEHRSVCVGDDIPACRAALRVVACKAHQMLPRQVEFDYRRMTGARTASALHAGSPCSAQQHRSHFRVASSEQTGFETRVCVRCFLETL